MISTVVAPEAVGGVCAQLARLPCISYCLRLPGNIKLTVNTVIKAMTLACLSDFLKQKKKIKNQRCFLDTELIWWRVESMQCKKQTNKQYQECK